ncbi:MAG: transposase [Actinomycetia bacterium]|nr:transposase [Actinomycetes bacterium]
MLKRYDPVVLTLFDDLSPPTPWRSWRNGLSVSQLTCWLRQQRNPHAEAAAARMHALLQVSALAATPGKAHAQIRWVRPFVVQLPALEAHWGEIRAQIAEPFTAHADLDSWARVPGAGPLLGARLMAALGANRDRLASEEAVQALAGTSPVAYQSGKRQRVHLRRACDEPIR